jgi:hypothetical protein
VWVRKSLVRVSAVIVIALVDFNHSERYIFAMTRRSRKKGKKDKVISDVQLKPVGQVQLTPTEKPTEPPEDKRIHPRRPLPLIPEKSTNDEEDDGE